MDCLEKAIDWAGVAPEILNSDQGSQFTSKLWVETVELLGSQVSHDGVKRAIHNIMIERVWRSLKYENIYPMCYGSIPAAEEGIGKYFVDYNAYRVHQAMDYRTPEEVIFGREKVRWGVSDRFRFGSG